ncbi:MAG: hypothetical protein HQL37_07630 [Alphaproteobacteria bacterium]|nr:hypothetical protein [Alphaproteobacteria bacterium]
MNENTFILTDTQDAATTASVLHNAAIDMRAAALEVSTYKEMLEMLANLMEELSSGILSPTPEIATTHTGAQHIIRCSNHHSATNIVHMESAKPTRHKTKRS